MSMETCGWCGRQFDTRDSFSNAFCSHRCYEAYLNKDKESEYQREMQEHNREMRELEEQRLEEEREYRYEQEQREEQARRESAARERERLEAEQDRAYAEQERLRVEQQRLEEDRADREYNKLISDIERDLSAYNIADITSAENIYQKVNEMGKAFCQKNSEYNWDKIHLHYMKAVLYKFGSDTASLNRFFAERDARAVENIDEALDAKHYISLDAVYEKYPNSTDKIKEYIDSIVPNLIKWHRFFEEKDFRALIKKRMQERFAPYQTEAYKQMSNDLNGTQWSKKFNHIALLSLANNTKEFINTQLNECCHSYQDAAVREGFFIIAAKKISSYQKSIRDFIDQYISNNVNLEKLKSSDNKYNLMTEAGRFELRCNDGDGTKEEVEDVFVKLLVEKLGWTDLPSLAEMREWENKRIVERPQMFEQMRKEKQAAKEKKESDEQALRDKFNIKNNDFIIVEKKGMDTFAICSHPVTCLEWGKFMYTQGSSHNPVCNISWNYAIAYCNRRSRKEGLTPCYKLVKQGLSYTVVWNRNANGYRLPTIEEQLAVGNKVMIREWCWDQCGSIRVGGNSTSVDLKHFGICYVCFNYSARHIYTKPGQKIGEDGNYRGEMLKESDLGFRVVRSCK